MPTSSATRISSTSGTTRSRRTTILLLRRRRSLHKIDRPLRIPLHIRPRILLKLGPIPPILVRNALLERVVRHRLDENIPDGLEDVDDLARGLPVLTLQQTYADVPQRVVGDVGVVDARREVDCGRLERVVDGKLEDQAEAAWRINRVGGRRDGDVPGVQVGVRGEGDGDSWGWGGGAVCEFLGGGRGVR